MLLFASSIKPMSFLCMRKIYMNGNCVYFYLKFLPIIFLALKYDKLTLYVSYMCISAQYTEYIREEPITSSPVSTVKKTNVKKLYKLKCSQASIQLLVQ